MKNKNAIYTILPSKIDNRSFPYPHLFDEIDTDYLCFTDNPLCTSVNWQIILLPALDSKYYLPYLTKYEHTFEISYNQIITDSLEEDSSLINVPNLLELYGGSILKDTFIPTADSHGNYLYKKNPTYTNNPFNGRLFQLTIGILVSNQIQTIRRCLSHLDKLRSSLVCELLVIDTGSTDGTVEVAQQYGARIISFPWCDNMSAARNAGIYHALGEWYLSIDDDEWFESTDSIINFFLSGQHKQFNFSGYIQRNYTKEDGSQYHDHYTCRMARITPSLHFEGRIHDALIFPKNEKIYYHEDYVHHYGFSYDDPDKVLQKTKRNIRLLALDHYEFPCNIRYILQIANEFNTIEQSDYAITYFYVGLSTLKQLHETNVNYEKQLLSSHLLLAFYHAHDKRLFSFSNKCLKNFSYSPKDLACIHYFRFDLAETLCYDDSFIEKELIAYQKNRTIFLSNVQKYNRSSFLELDVCQNKIFEHIYYIHKLALQTRKKDFSNTQKTLERLSIKDVSQISAQKFFRTLFHMPVSFFQIGFEKITTTNMPAFFSELLPLIQTGFLTYNMLPLSQLPENSPYSYLLSLYAGDYSSEKLSYFQKYAPSLLNLLNLLTNNKCYQFAFMEYLRIHQYYFNFLYHPSLQKEDSFSLLPKFDLSLFYINKAISHTQESSTDLKKAAILNPSLNRIINLLQNK